jgi:hypothetical protein
MLFVIIMCVFFYICIIDEQIDNNSMSENISTLFLEKHGTLLHSYSPKHLQDSCLSNAYIFCVFVFQIF